MSKIIEIKRHEFHNSEWYKIMKPVRTWYFSPLWWKVYFYKYTFEFFVPTSSGLTQRALDGLSHAAANVSEIKNNLLAWFRVASRRQ
jgi:hypothetical protein